MSTTYDAEQPGRRVSPRPEGEPGGCRLTYASADLPRVALSIVGVTAFLLGASGFATTEVFHQYTTLKWALLVAAPLLVIVLLTVERPSAWAMGLVSSRHSRRAVCGDRPWTTDLGATRHARGGHCRCGDRRRGTRGGPRPGVRRSCGYFPTRWCCS